jgi:hypothetical protein
MFALVSALLSLGGSLIVFGRQTHWVLPWALIGQVPPLRYALPGRFTVYLWLALAVGLAVLLGERRARRVRWVLALAACVSVLPNFDDFRWATPVDAPALMRGGRLARYVPPGSTVLALPFGIEGNSMIWQVEAGFQFRLAGGYVSWALPKQYAGLTIIRELTGQPPGGRLKQRLCAFIEMTGTTVILLREGAPGDWAATLAPLRVRQVHDGGFAIYSLRSSSCDRVHG